MKCVLCQHNEQPPHRSVCFSCVPADACELIAAEERRRIEEQLAETQNEIASVLILMDNQANIWGDEGVFRRCRDRLRALLPKQGAA